MKTEKLNFSMNLTATLAVEQLAKIENKNTDEVLISFMKSDTAKMLYDDSTKLWWDGPLSVVELYEEE